MAEVLAESNITLPQPEDTLCTDIAGNIVSPTSCLGAVASMRVPPTVDRFALGPNGAVKSTGVNPEHPTPRVVVNALSGWLAKLPSNFES